MARFPTVPENPQLAHVFHRFPKGVRTLCKLHDEILRAESELTIGERELIAAVTSATNACNFCFDAHRRIAQAFEVDVDLVDAIATDFSAAPVDSRMRPLLAYVVKLTQAPARMTDSDSDAVYAAGWSEDALMDAIFICGLFNMMNRIVEGTGVVPRPDQPAMDASMRAAWRDRSYADFAEAAIAGKFSAP